MKKSKTLIVCLIGLLLAAGLVLAMCNNYFGCKCGKHIDDGEVYDNGKCSRLFCAKDWDATKECNCD